MEQKIEFGDLKSFLFNFYILPSFRHKLTIANLFVKMVLNLFSLF